MDAIREIVSEVGLEEYINCLIVQHDLRKAMLIQPIDYNEMTGKDPQTFHILTGISKHFPELKQSEIHEGILISKKSYKASDFQKSADIGHVLGYACADDFDYIMSHEDEPSTTIEVTVLLKDGYNKDSLQLFVNRCRNERTFLQTVVLGQKIETLLLAHPFLKLIVTGVKVNKTVTIPIKNLIKKLATNVILTDDEKEEVYNHIWNLGFSDVLSATSYDYKNPVHRGILIGLLTLCDNNPLSAFYPLQNYPKKMTLVNKITELWEGQLVQVFSQTKRGGKRKTRKKLTQ